MTDGSCRHTEGRKFRCSSVSDGCRLNALVFLPAAGYRNDTSLNNAGSWGNYWSRTLNTNNANNAYNLNFNSGNVNWNNNNRYNGQSVRPVRLSTHRSSVSGSASFFYDSVLLKYKLTRDQLLADLHQAYLDARRHKRNKTYQRLFEARLEKNLASLCDDLWTRTYQPRPSTCFLINAPKLREIFAADFRDRIVHHLYYNYVHEMLERTFIFDSYSCIKHRGTHFGIDRLRHHILQESQNYSETCYVLKMDIRGYFMHINRQLLLEITLRRLRHMARKRCCRSSSETWQMRVDMDFVEYLSREIILLNPTLGCCIHGDCDGWRNLPREKSLFCSPEGCGLPIGNLTSQLLSNVYLGELDDFIKRDLRCRHYGRYVDDFYLVSADVGFLRSAVPQIADFLKNHLKLELHDGKIRICNVLHGVEFLGAYLKPFRNYVSRTTLFRMRRKMPALEEKTNGCTFRSSVNSQLGILSHYRSFAIQLKMFLILFVAWQYGYFVVRKCGLLFRLF